MGGTVRVAVGILGNAASLLLFAAPILTFKRVIRKRSTQEFSCIPYVAALLNCLLYTLYGLPIVSRGWENFSLVTIDGIGILLETSFIFIYMWFAVPGKKEQVIKAKSVEYMPFYLSFFSLCSSSLWMAYGLLGRDLFLAAPSFLGCPVALLQLVLYGMYRKRNEAHTEPNKVDLEKSGAQTDLQGVTEKGLGSCEKGLGS